MKAWGEIEKGTVLTLSTAHIDPASLNILERRYERGEEYDADHWVNNMVWANFMYGYGVTGHSVRRQAQDHTDETPRFILNLAELVNDLRPDWIIFDQDGSKVSGLEAFDH